MQYCKREINFGGTSLVLETGELAKQANGAVLATYGETVVLATLVRDRTLSQMDYLPFMVNYQERMYSAGRIPGSFFRREGRPSEDEILTSRLIDRSLRPSFPSEYRYDTQLTCMVLSSSGKKDEDIISIIAASAAVALSDAPVHFTVAGCRVGISESGEYVLNPDTDRNALDMVVSGHKDSVVMIEAGALEASENLIIKGAEFALEYIRPVVDMIEDMRRECGREKLVFPEVASGESSEPGEHHLLEEMRSEIVTSLNEKVFCHAGNKEARTDALRALTDEVQQAVDQKSTAEECQPHAARFVKSCYAQQLRSMICEKQVRVDGRGLADIRDISGRTNLLPGTHGSSLFTRGGTQAIVTVTLGAEDDRQLVDALQGLYKETFMLHYNFPGFCVGEISRRPGLSRREVGHGKLAWRAVKRILPDAGTFPYTIRIVSDTLESDGSSSMAAICGASMSLMDAGVPIKAPVAGIAMGLVIDEKDGETQVHVLSDIIGDEDSCGDMDFKVAGTSGGIMALQLDLKVGGVTEAILCKALEQAREGRLFILSELDKVISKARASVKGNAPRFGTVQIPKDKIREVIGAGGKVIKGICEKTGARLDISDDGTCSISAPGEEQVQAAIAAVQNILEVPQVDMEYEGRVERIVENVGAVVSFLGGRFDGLVHVQKIPKQDDKYVKDISDLIQVSQKVRVRVLPSNDPRRTRLTMLGVQQPSEDK